jgi:serine/threonine-protein kinase
VLPEAFATDAERLARFEREAELLASLNHPHIAALHGLEESNGVRALILEFVDGPTLADRIAQGPISLDEAMPIARQVAEALEAAHERGIIHRDLKPANIKIARFGQQGLFGGSLNVPHAIAVDSRGNLYVGENFDARRFQRFLYKGLGTPVPGSNPPTTTVR